MNIIKDIISRKSFSKLMLPHPTQKEMELVYNAALRAPDHAWLRPSRFVEITGAGLDKLSNIFETFAKKNIKDINEQTINKYKNAPYRAPMIIMVLSNIKEHPKVPKIEQMLSTAAATQNILLALHSLNYGAIWRTGALALNDEILGCFNLPSNQIILGYLYVGTSIGEPKKIPNININDFVDRWR